MKQIDRINIDKREKVVGVLLKLLETNPEISWRIERQYYDQMNDQPSSHISLMVPSSQYEEAKQIYEEFKEQFFVNDLSIFDPLISEIIEFRDERNWKQFHNPKDLALSLSLEASELLENFQWKTSEEAVIENMNNIKDEIADVVIYAMFLSHELGINLEHTIKEKINKNKRKYPVEKAFGSRKKYTKL